MVTAPIGALLSFSCLTPLQKFHHSHFREK
jgi:hypothetical protein